MRFYVTFGVQYSQDPHPVLPKEVVNPNGYLVIEGEGIEIGTARALASALTDNAYAFIYPWPEPGSEEDSKMRHYYPDGANATLAFTVN